MLNLHKTMFFRTYYTKTINR